PAQQLRATHLAFGLCLIFLLYPGFGRWDRKRVPIWDIALAILSVVALGYMVLNFQQVAYRIVRPTDTDILWGIITLILVLEASRRTTGCRSEEHTSELQSRENLVCRLLLE